MRSAVIVDTNVLIGALPTAHGAGPYAAILQAMLACELWFVLSDALVREYRAVLLREALLTRHGHGRAGVDALLEALEQRAQWIAPPADVARNAPRAPERGDQMLWDLLASQPQSRLVTEDAALRRDRNMRARVIGARTLLDELNAIPASAIAPELIAAYRAARYRVDAQPAFELVPDVCCPPLGTLHSAHAVRASAFITACNPASQVLEPARNAQRTQALHEELRARGLHAIAGVGEDRDQQWPAESSWLALGIDLHDACALASDQGQNAIIWTGSDVVPRLVLLR